MISSTGLRRAVLCLDLGAAINRMHITGDGAEMAHLDAEQLALYGASLDVPGDHPVFEHLAALIGQKANP